MNARRSRQNFTKKKTRDNRAQSFKWQAMASNASGRHRTMDHMLPLQPLDEGRPKPKGRGAWKQWTPEALLRSAFGEATATVRQSAREVDGASAAHVIKARLFIAKCILDCQSSHVQSERNRLSQSGMLYHILNMMFDETELEVALTQAGPASWSILASQSQLSIHAAGQDVEIDIARPPRALPRKTASCMWGFCRFRSEVFSCSGIVRSAPSKYPTAEALALSGAAESLCFSKLVCSAQKRKCY